HTHIVVVRELRYHSGMVPAKKYASDLVLFFPFFCIVVHIIHVITSHCFFSLNIDAANSSPSPRRPLSTPSVTSYCKPSTSQVPVQWEQHRQSALCHRRSCIFTSHVAIVLAGVLDEVISWWISFTSFMLKYYEYLLRIFNNTRRVPKYGGIQVNEKFEQTFPSVINGAEIEDNNHCSSELGNEVCANVKIFTCRECKKKCKTIGGLKQHINKFHSGTELLRCSKCSFESYSKYNFDFHIEIHNNNKNYPCCKCNQKFSCKRNLRRHMLIQFIGSFVNSASPKVLQTMKMKDFVVSHDSLTGLTFLTRSDSVELPQLCFK
ncbi:Zinc finger protein GLI4, partial [Armadillidium vulgare]